MAKEYIEREAIELLAKDRLSFYNDKLYMEMLIGNDITANAAKQRFDTAREVFDLVKSIFPAADVQEVRHAHWEYFFDIEEMARCSNCYEVLKKGRASCYCPHCGAKMDKESEQE